MNSTNSVDNIFHATKKPIRAKFRVMVKIFGISENQSFFVTTFGVEKTRITGWVTRW